VNLIRDAEWLQITSHTLRSAGYQVFDATSHTDALQLIAEVRPAIIVLDRAGSSEVRRRLKADQRTVKAMILCVSSGELPQPPHKGPDPEPEWEVDGYVRMPIAADELLTTVRTLLRIQSGEHNPQPVEQGVKDQHRADVKDRQNREGRYRQIAETAHLGMWLIDREGRTIFVNPRMAEMLACPHEHLAGAGLYEFCFPDDVSKVRIQLGNNFRGLSDQFDFRFRRGDGSTLSVLAETCPFDVGGGGANYALWVCADITARKRSEVDLREAWERLQYALESADMVAWDWSPESDVVIQSTNASRVLNLPPGSTLHSGKEYFAMIHPEDQPRVVAAVQRALRDQGDYHEEFRLVLADGTVRWVADHGRVTMVDGSKSARMNGVIRDITQLKTRETALRESEGRFRATFHQAAVGMCLMGPDGRFLQTNERMCELLDMAESELTMRNLFDVTHPDDREANRKLMNRLLLGGAGNISLEQRLVRRDGSPVWVSMYLALLLDAGGRLEHVIGVIQDIHARKIAEHQLQQLNADLEQRVAARTRDLVHSQNRLRKLASDLSLTEERERRRIAGELHDYLAQLLVATRMKLNQTRPWRSTKYAATLGEVDRMLDQALTYTRTLVAQLSPPVLYQFGVPAALKWLGDQMERHGLRVRTHIGGERLSLSEEEAVLLFQSARELLLNVVKHAGCPSAEMRLEVVAGNLHLTVRDDGRGFDSTAVRDSSASGNTFGLFSIRERMESLGGRVDIATAPHQGTKVTLVMPLPLDTGEVQTSKTVTKESIGAVKDRAPMRVTTIGGPESAGAVGAAAPARIRVLLADDHAMVRQGLRSLLEGHQDMEVVAEAGDGMQAVALADEVRPDVVVMDLNLPSLDGVEATRRICARHPSIVVVGLSVHQSRHVEEAIRAAGAATYLTKDCAVDQLYEAITSSMMARSA
jgi:PAS domain S-box-containing protein